MHRSGNSSPCGDQHPLLGMLHNRDHFKLTLNENSEDELRCTGYTETYYSKVLHCTLCIVTIGFWLLISYWKPEWKLKLCLSQCLLQKATKVLLKDVYKQHFVEEIQKVLVDNTSELQFVCINSGNSSEECDNDDDDTRALTPTNREEPYLMYFDHQQIRYIWDPSLNCFIRLLGLDSGIKCIQLHQDYRGIPETVQKRKQTLYGHNVIEIDVPSYAKLFITEVLNPFYVFQIVSVALWMSDDYYYYASCIILISFISIGVSLYETRKQRETLRDMVSSTSSTITVCRGEGVHEEVDMKELVPGDLIVLPSQGCMMACDAVLITGNCIVNESMLTGESVPVTKTPLQQQEDNELYSSEVHKRHTLFSGTQVIQTRYYGQAKVTAVVVQTGFSTAKGLLVRSILFPKPMDFQFYKDAIRFIMVLGLLASIGMAYTLYVMITNKANWGDIVKRTLDVITITIPPALPAAMTVGIVYAQRRLKKQGIFCISPPRINMCGKINVVCFDKTGTLTEDGLDMWGVIPTSDNRFLSVVHQICELPRGPLVAAMATCHSLTRIDGELSGDPLDLKMFLSTNWVLEEPCEDRTRFDSLMPTVVHPSDEELGDILGDQIPYEVGIVRQFTFSSALQRMSVITRTLGKSNMDVYCKGAPEKISSLCHHETVPDNFHDTLHSYTMKGFRVIAMAWRSLDPKLAWHQAQKIHRDQVECDLNFLGLLVMQNTLKPETTPIIRQLLEAEIRNVMVTGDNMLTALSVARECEMISSREQVVLVEATPPEDHKPAYITWQFADSFQDVCSNTDSYYPPQVLNLADSMPVKQHLAMDGKSFAVIKQHFPNLLPKICVRGTIFARMSPDQKSQLVEQLQQLDYIVGMCGDGANDCGALKMAHAGISLSEAEASVASPFTSKTPNIECVPTVIREGRAALVTSFGTFKYMALYSMIQFITVLILYTIQSNLGDQQFLYLDLVITTTVAILMGHTAAYPYLVKQRPRGRLISAPVLFSIIFEILVQFTFQIGVFLYLRLQSWCIPFKGSFSKQDPVSHEVTLLFTFSAFQYIIMAVSYSKGPPYRKQAWTNVPFLVAVLLLTAVTLFLWLHPFKFLEDFFQLKHLGDKFILFKGTIIMLAAANFFISFLTEVYIVDSNLVKKLFRLLKRKTTPRSQHKLIEAELKKESDWPPVGQVTWESSPLEATWSIN